MNLLAPVHPGEVLEQDFMKPNRLSNTALARAIGVAPARINEIVRGRRGITAGTALRLARYFNTDAQSWMNLQSQYELTLAARAADNAVANHSEQGDEMMPDQNECEPTCGRTITGAWRELLGCDYVDEWMGRADCLYENQGNNIFPPRECVFRAFAECPLDCLKVVILGDQPYKNNHADGLAFSTAQEGAVPPSLWIIFSEILRDICPDVCHENGDLSRWARQGVLLLNSWLTTGQNRGSIRWGDFTKGVISRISARRNPIVFMLWGAKAIEKERHINNANGRHLILKSSHPSPKGAFWGGVPFADCRHFSQANEHLGENRAVNWR